MATAPDKAKLGSGAARERVELILSQIEQLPTLPAVAIRLLEATTSPETSARDVVRIIETDQSLTSKVLSLVRRADVGVRGEVMTVDRAVVLLGFQTVRNAVLSIQVYETFASAEPHDATDFDRSDFWKHSLGVACAAQLIGEQLKGRGLGDEAFVCGLLHDVGKVALDACLPKSYARVVREVQGRHRCICDVERELLGLDHTIAGKRLLTRWGLPKSLVESAWLHHQPPRGLPPSAASRTLLKVVHAADNLVRYQRIGFSGYNHTERPEALAAEIGLSPEGLAEVTRKLPARIEEHCQLVGQDELTSTSIYAGALSQANEELGRVNASLSLANRRLEQRSQYFDALRSFLGQLSLSDRVLDVCRTAARCTVELLGHERAVAFASGPGEPAWHVGVAAENGEAADAVIPKRSRGEAGLAVRPGGGALASIGSVPEMARGVCERFDRYLVGDRVWMLPFLYAGDAVGGVLFVAPAEDVERANRAETELAALCNAFGLAVATAASRQQGQRLNEELADANRQLFRAQAEVLRARSLSMIAEMAAGAAHELNNPLAVISGRSQMLARDAGDDVRRRALEIVHEQARRASEIVSELMDFAKPDPPQPIDVLLGGWAESLRRRWLERSSLKPEQFVLEISDPDVAMRVDAGQLEQISEAIISNALEAMSENEPRLVINSISNPSDDTVTIAVEDNGTGMGPEVLEHALDPFFSYRLAGRGRGLGLSRAARLVETNGGRLWLDSMPGVGTTVYVELPTGHPA